MAEIVYVISPTITLPNITVEEKYADDVLMAHRITANEGYVIYDTSDNTTEPDPETMISRPVTYYYRQATINVRVPVENWTWVAVLESTVDENYIF